MMRNQMGWYEIPVNDMPRAQSFYETIFGVKLDLQSSEGIEMAWFPMAEDKYGAAGTLAKGEMYKPTKDGVKVYFTVEDINATLDLVSQNGGTVVMPETAIGEYGFIGMFEDTEGNVVGIHRKAEGK